MPISKSTERIWKRLNRDLTGKPSYRANKKWDKITTIKRGFITMGTIKATTLYISSRNLTKQMLITRFHYITLNFQIIL